jgi:hypothetical protein
VGEFTGTLVTLAVGAGVCVDVVTVGDAVGDSVTLTVGALVGAALGALVG